MANNIDSIAVVVTTHDRVTEARANVEIIRARWAQVFTGGITIVHARNVDDKTHVNGVDASIWLPNRGHFQGAVDLIETGIATLDDLDSVYRASYVVHLSADTWLANPSYLRGVIHAMNEDGKSLASCAWGDERDGNPWKVGLALDFLVLHRRWSKHVG